MYFVLGCVFAWRAWLNCSKWPSGLERCARIAGQMRTETNYGLKFAGNSRAKKYVTSCNSRHEDYILEEKILEQFVNVDNMKNVQNEKKMRHFI